MTTAARPIASRLVCAGCGHEAPPVPGASGGYPFGCANVVEGDNVDHVLARTLDLNSLAFPRDPDPNPFVAYRTLFHSWHVARAFGMPDADYVALVRRLDDEIGRADGRGFRITPFATQPGIGDRLGLSNVWVKDETGNVSGSHKARHLAGIMIYLQVLDAVGVADSRSRRLAIASCGNAALAAAVVARAGQRGLDVFIPPDAPDSVVARLRELGASPIVCPREGDAPGDPCYLRFREVVARGALPFCCQGSANGLTIEGGETLGWEMISALGTTALDAVVVQVGGGALASAIVQSFVEAHAMGACPRLPRIYTVQTRGAFPLKRAYDRLVERRSRGIVGPVPQCGMPTSHEINTRDGQALPLDSPEARRDLEYAATHRHEFMWPWETEPRSLARGILDDETYDWLAVVKGMLQTGGRPVVADEQTLADAHDLARSATAIPVDHTGAAGLAGLIELARTGEVAPHEQVAVVFSGRER